MKNEIKWRRDREVSNELIESVEKHFNVKFPKRYVEIVKKHDSGCPKLKTEKGEWAEAFLDIHSFNNRTTGLRLYSYYRTKYHNIPQIISANNTIKDTLPNPQKIISFADNGGGDDLLFDYRKNENEPAIVFMDHEQTYDARDFSEEELDEKPLEEWLEINIHHVCDSFDELLDLLYPDDFSDIHGDK